jgi:hypothetical protein
MSAPNGFILLTTCRSATLQSERIVAFPWQKWTSERATMLCYTHIAHLVFQTMASDLSEEKKTL